MVEDEFKFLRVVVIIDVGPVTQPFANAYAS